MHVAQTSGKAHTVSEAWLAESSSPTLRECASQLQTDLTAHVLCSIV